MRERAKPCASERDETATLSSTGFVDERGFRGELAEFGVLPSPAEVPGTSCVFSTQRTLGRCGRLALPCCMGKLGERDVGRATNARSESECKRVAHASTSSIVVVAASFGSVRFGSVWFGFVFTVIIICVLWVLSMQSDKRSYVMANC